MLQFLIQVSLSRFSAYRGRCCNSLQMLMKCRVNGKSLRLGITVKDVYTWGRITWLSFPRITSASVLPLSLLYCQVDILWNLNYIRSQPVFHSKQPFSKNLPWCITQVCQYSSFRQEAFKVCSEEQKNRISFFFFYIAC